MRLTAQVLLGFVGSASLATAALADWTEVSNTTHKFSASFPAKPEVDSSVQNGIKNNTTAAVDNGVMCIVVVGDYGYTIKPDVELPASRDSFVKGVSATVTTEKRITFPRGATMLPASEFDAASDGYTFRTILVIDGSLAYQVTGGV